MSSYNKELKLAVIGRSASGKSAFIKSFSNYPDLITSEGEGQTTRSYGEYVFHSKSSDILPEVQVEIMTEDYFVEFRTSSSMEKLMQIDDNCKELNLEWLREQYEDEEFKTDIDSAIIHVNDFYDINEFYYLDNGKLVEKLSLLYDEFVGAIKHLGISSLSDYPNFNLENLSSPPIAKENDEHVEIVDDASKIELMLRNYFKLCYKEIVEAIKDYYISLDLFEIKNSTVFLSFQVCDRYKDELTRFLKVTVEGKKKESLTGIISKVKIVSYMSEDYVTILKRLNIDRITLIDTYGLDHSQQCTDDVLKERYNRIFNIDYPETTVTLFIEGLNAGPSNDFVKALSTLYSVRPDIMSYVIGTRIDQHDEELLMSNKEWLTSLSKDIERPPALNGKVIDHLFKTKKVSNGLRRSNISSEMAKKRQEVMQKKFGPFCGKNDSRIDDELFKTINLNTIKSVFTSIIEKEHLGDEFVKIDHIIRMSENDEIIRIFLKHMVTKMTESFENIYNVAAARTKGKIRENLSYFTLGFNGSTLDATWVRVLNSAFNETFTKEIKLNGDGKTSLSSKFELEGNEKLAFDEILNISFPYLFAKACTDENRLSPWNREVCCWKCRKEGSFKEDCMWGLLINVAGSPNFGNSYRYDRVYQWLNELHDFAKKFEEGHYDVLVRLFQEYLNTEFVNMARAHNLKVAAKKVMLSDMEYNEVRDQLYNEYKEKHDRNITKQYFFSMISDLVY